MDQKNVLPRDGYHFVYGTVFLLGITSLLPWNFFITANDYWMYKFRDMNDTIYIVDPDYKSDFQASFTSYLVIASKVPFVFFLLVNTVLSSRVSPTIRVAIPLVICLLLFCVTASLVYVDTDYHQTEFLAITLAKVALINVVAAFLQGGGMGISGALPQKYMSSNVYGQATGGVFASVVQILTLVGDSSPQASALAYFICAILTMILTLVAFLFMKKIPFYSYYMSTQVGKHHLNETVHAEDSQTKVPLPKLVKQLWMFELTTVVIFWVTLTAFPAVVVLVSAVDSSSGIAGRLFAPVACFLPFNIFDVVGRVLASYFPLPKQRTGLLLAFSILRVVFIPLLMLCNAHPRNLTKVVFDTDYCFVIFVILFSLSNGYLFSIAITNGPKVVEVQYQEIAGSILAFCLGLGLALGSITSYGIIKLI